MSSFLFSLSVVERASEPDRESEPHHEEALRGSVSRTTQQAHPADPGQAAATQDLQ